MKAFMRTVAAVALLSGGVLPAAAAVDVPTLTCGGFSALDSVARLEAATAVLEWIHADNSTKVAPELVAKYGIEGLGWDSEDGDKMKIEIEGHCSDATTDILVLDRLKEHS